jgi:hypothetical protein
MTPISNPKDRKIPPRINVSLSGESHAPPQAAPFANSNNNEGGTVAAATPQRVGKISAASAPSAFTPPAIPSPSFRARLVFLGESDPPFAKGAKMERVVARLRRGTHKDLSLALGARKRCRARPWRRGRRSNGCWRSRRRRRWCSRWCHRRSWRWRYRWCNCWRRSGCGTCRRCSQSGQLRNTRVEQERLVSCEGIDCVEISVRRAAIEDTIRSEHDIRDHDFHRSNRC